MNPTLPLPKYHQIYLVLREQLREGQFADGLPPEIALSKQFAAGRVTVRRALELEPDSVTIYQMELPFNTVYSKDILGNQIETPVADWPTKRGWVDYAFDQFLGAGYAVSSAYTLVRHP